VVPAGELQAVLETLVFLPLACIAAWWLCRLLVDWREWEWLIRRRLRRMRLRAIREARAV